uniref:Uncharacterized protein n=1 Tax=Bionectria ochroleuca TaxID=29856 RepID=A0A8H7K0Y3_BIOOC
MSPVAPPAQAVIRRGAAFSEAGNEETDSTRRLNQQRALDFHHWLLQALNSLPASISQPANPSLLPQFRSQWNLPPPRNSPRVIELPDTTPPLISPPRATESRFARRHSIDSSSSGSLLLPPRALPPRGKSQDELDRDAHDHFIADVKRLLNPLTSEEEGLVDEGSTIYNEGSVFLCWGSATNCRVLSVKHFQRDMDHELFWKKLHHAWYQTRGEWRHKIPWYGIRDVKMVNIRLAGPVRGCPDQFHGVFQSIDGEVQREKEKLRQKIRKFQEAEAEADRERWRKRSDEDDYYDYDYDYDDWDWDKCVYDAKLGRTLHGDECIANLSQFQEDCEHGEHPESKNRLNGLMMESLRTSLFLNPQMAVFHRLSNSDLVLYKSTVRSQVEGNPYRGLGQMVFRGLLIEDGWAFDGGMGVLCMPLAGVAAILLVFLAWLVYRDWAIAWNVGSCMVPLLIGLASALPQARAPRA